MDRFVERTRSADVVYLSPSFHCLGEPCPGHFQATAEAATRIDLKGRSLSDVQSGFEPSVRQSINKGARIGLEVVRCADRESFLVAHQLYLQTMWRNRAIARYSVNWFDALHRVLSSEGLASVYMVRHNGEPVSATVVIESQRGCHLLHSGSSTEHLSLRANDVVVCEIIKKAIAEGREFADFMLSDPLDTALIRWKEKFGGKTFMLKKYSRINRPLKHALWSGAKKVYPFFSSFRKSR